MDTTSLKVFRKQISPIQWDYGLSSSSSDSENSDWDDMENSFFRGWSSTRRRQLIKNNHEVKKLPRTTNGSRKARQNPNFATKTIPKSVKCYLEITPSQKLQENFQEQKLEAEEDTAAHKDPENEAKKKQTPLNGLEKVLKHPLDTKTRGRQLLQQLELLQKTYQLFKASKAISDNDNNIIEEEENSEGESSDSSTSICSDCERELQEIDVHFEERLPFSEKKEKETKHRRKKQQNAHHQRRSFHPIKRTLHHASHLPPSTKNKRFRSEGERSLRARKARDFPEINILPANFMIAKHNSFLNRCSYYPYDANFKLLKRDEAQDSYYSHQPEENAPALPPRRKVHERSK